MKPILFNTEMVRAILDGRKTVTRRPIKPQPKSEVVFYAGIWQESQPCANGVRIFPPPYRPGDILYVRETWCDPTPNQSGYPVLYKADMPMHWDAEDTECGVAVTLQAKDYKWRPSIHMPKEAARIFLRVTNVWVERLQDITEDEAFAEGAQTTATFQSTRSVFFDIWDSTIKPTDRAVYGWEANPWVWVIEFERIGKEDALKGGRT